MDNTNLTLTEEELRKIKSIYYKFQYKRRKSQDPDLIKKSQKRREKWLSRLTEEQRKEKLKKYSEAAKRNFLAKQSADSSKKN